MLGASARSRDYPKCYDRLWRLQRISDRILREHKRQLKMNNNKAKNNTFVSIDNSMKAKVFCVCEAYENMAQSHNRHIFYTQRLNVFPYQRAEAETEGEDQWKVNSRIWKHVTLLSWLFAVNFDRQCINIHKIQMRNRSRCHRTITWLLTVQRDGIAEIVYAVLICDIVELARPDCVHWSLSSYGSRHCLALSAARLIGVNSKEANYYLIVIEIEEDIMVFSFMLTGSNVVGIDSRVLRETHKNNDIWCRFTRHCHCPLICLSIISYAMRVLYRRVASITARADKANIVC